MTRLPLSIARSCSARQISEAKELGLNNAIVTCRAFDPPLDLRAPDCAASDALCVKPGVETLLRKIGLEALGKFGAVFVSFPSRTTVPGCNC
jgi:hypothetical protein